MLALEDGKIGRLSECCQNDDRRLNDYKPRAEELPNFFADYGLRVSVDGTVRPVIYQ